MDINFSRTELFAIKDALDMAEGVFDETIRFVRGASDGLRMRRDECRRLSRRIQAHLDTSEDGA